ncbi:MAG: biopolymer transporter ExbD [Planctomycetota bacterium]
MRLTARRPEHGVELPITPLIDVVFLLLIFFLVTASFSTPQDQLSAGLISEDGGSGRVDLLPQIVLVSADADGAPSYTIGSRTVGDEAALREILERLPKEPGVILRVSNSAGIKHVAAGMQAAFDAGFTRRSYVAGR